MGPCHMALIEWHPADLDSWVRNSSRSQKQSCLTMFHMVISVASMTSISDVLVPKNSKRDIAMSGLMSVLRKGLVGVSNGGLRIWPWWLLGRRQHSSRFVVGLHDQKVQAKVHQFWWHTRSMTHVCPLFGWWLMDVDGPHMVPTILATCIFGFLGWWSHIYQAVFSPLLSSASRCWPGRSAVLRDGERLGGVAPDATGGALYPWRPFLWRPGRAGWALGDGGWDLGETWGRLGGNRETLRIVWVYGDLFQEDWQWLARMGHFCKHGAEHVVSKKVIDWCLRSSHTQT